jgi:succinate dehydrogenase flavin-adding protein (antitoxin of CptAB toxin-antitoxin module)
MDYREMKMNFKLEVGLSEKEVLLYFYALKETKKAPDEIWKQFEVLLQEKAKGMSSMMRGMSLPHFQLFVVSPFYVLELTAILYGASDNIIVRQREPVCLLWIN